MNFFKVLAFYFELKNPDINNNIFIPIIIYSQNSLKKTNYLLLEHSFLIENESLLFGFIAKTIDPLEVSALSSLYINAFQKVADKDNILLLYFDYDLKFSSSEITIEGVNCDKIYLKNFKILVLKFLTNDQKVEFKVTNIINPDHILFPGIKAYLSQKKGFENQVTTFMFGASIEFTPKNAGTFLVECDNNELYSKSKCSISFTTDFSKSNYIKISFPSQLKILHDICFPKIDSQIKVVSCKGDQINNSITINIVPDSRSNIKLSIETKEEGTQILETKTNLDFFVEGCIESEGFLSLVFRNTFSQIFSFTAAVYDASSILSALDYDNVLMDEEVFYTPDLKNSNSFLKFSIIFDYENSLTDGAMIIQLPHPDLEIMINKSKAGNLVKNKLVCLVNDDWKNCSYEIIGIPGSTKNIIKIYNLAYSLGEKYNFYITVIDSLGQNYVEKFKRNKNSIRISAVIYFDSNFERALFYINPEIFLMTLNLFSSWLIEILTSFANTTNLFYISFKVNKIINQMIIEFPVFTYDQKNAWDPDLGGFYELNQFPCSFGVNNIISAEDPPICFFRAGSKDGLGMPARVMVNNLVVKDLEAMNTVILTGFLNPKDIDINVPLKVYGMKDHEILFYQEMKKLFRTKMQSIQKAFTEPNLPMTKPFLRKDNSLKFQSKAGCARFFLIKIKNDECFFNDVDNASKFSLTGIFGSELIKFYLVILEKPIVINEIMEIKNVNCISCNSVNFDFLLFESYTIYQINYLISFSSILMLSEINPFTVGKDKVGHDFAIREYGILDNVAVLTFELPSFYAIIEDAANLQINMIMIVKLKLNFYKHIKECMIIRGLVPRKTYSSILCEISQPDPSGFTNLKIINFGKLILNTNFQIYVKFDSGTELPANGDNAIDLAFYSNELALTLNNPFIYSSIAYSEDNIDKIKKSDHYVSEGTFEVLEKTTGCVIKFVLNIYESPFPSIKIVLPSFLRRTNINISVLNISIQQFVYTRFALSYDLTSNSLTIALLLGNFAFAVPSTVNVSMEISNLLISFNFLFFRVLYGSFCLDFYTTKVGKNLYSDYMISKKFILGLTPAIYNKQPT